MDLQENGNVRAALSTTDVIEVTFFIVLYHLTIIIIIIIFLKESLLKFLTEFQTSSRWRCICFTNTTKNPGRLYNFSI